MHQTIAIIRFQSQCSGELVAVKNTGNGHDVQNVQTNKFIPPESTALVFLIDKAGQMHYF
jgi:hypothetical protein